MRAFVTAWVILQVLVHGGLGFVVVIVKVVDWLESMEWP